jgi:hypothetical protein
MYGTREIYAVMNEQRLRSWGKGFATAQVPVHDGWGTKWRVVFISDAYMARLSGGTGDVTKIVESYEKLGEGHIDLRSVRNYLSEKG